MLLLFLFYSSCLKKKKIFVNFLSPSPAPTSPLPLPCKNLYPRSILLNFSAFLFSATGSSFLLHADPACTSSVFSSYPSLSPPTNCPSSLFCLHSHCIHQILESVHHIHQHDIVHRDLKVSICRGASASNPPNPDTLNLRLLPFTLSVLFLLSILLPPCHVYRCQSCFRPSDSFLSGLFYSVLLSDHKGPHKKCSCCLSESAFHVHTDVHAVTSTVIQASASPPDVFYFFQLIRFFPHSSFLST